MYNTLNRQKNISANTRATLTSHRYWEKRKTVKYSEGGVVILGTSAALGPHHLSLSYPTVWLFAEEAG